MEEERSGRLGRRQRSGLGAAARGRVLEPRAARSGDPAPLCPAVSPSPPEEHGGGGLELSARPQVDPSASTGSPRALASETGSSWPPGLAHTDAWSPRHGHSVGEAPGRDGVPPCVSGERSPLDSASRMLWPKERTVTLGINVYELLVAHSEKSKATWVPGEGSGRKRCHFSLTVRRHVPGVVA